VAGDPSADQNFVTGDVVNIAARLEQAADPGDILIGTETHRLARDAVHVEPVEPMELKGKPERVAAFRLLEVLPGAPALARRLNSPLVGRQEELARLREALGDAVSRRTCRMTTVVGDAGVGKSRLASELVNGVDEVVRVAWGRCLPYGEGITFWPVAEVVKTSAGIEDQDTPEVARTKIRKIVETADDPPGIADRVATAIGLGEGTGDIQETFWAVRKLLEHLAASYPLVVVFEDIHWAEGTFLDMLQYVASFSTEVPILVLCTARPDIREIRPGWGDVSDMIFLQALSTEECSLLIENLLGQAGLTGRVADRITESAEGNPLFVEEMLRMLIDERVLVRDNGHWNASGDLTRVSIPGTINALLAARLDQLQNEERAVIQRAAVIGKVFWWGAVSDLSPEDHRSRVASHLQALLRKELVRPDRSTFSGEDAFRFSHILVRDAAYGSMPKRSRADLHRRFASWLERKAGDRVAEFEEILGHHLERSYLYRTELGPVDDEAASIGRRAAEHLAAAGRRAQAHGDISASDNLLTRAADLLPPDDPARSAILADLGMVLAQSDIRRADQLLTEAMEEARATGDRTLEARAATRRVFVRLLLDPHVDQQASLDETGRWQAVFQDAGDDAGLAEAERVVGVLHFWQGQAAEAALELEQAMVHAGTAEDRRQEAETLKWLAIVHALGPTPVDEAIGHLESVLDRAHGNRRVEIAVTRTRAEMEAMRGRFEAARELITRAKTLTDDLGDLVGMAAVQRHSAAIEMLAGDPQAAETALRPACEMLERISDWGHLSSHLPDLGDTVYSQGRYEEALELSLKAERITIEGDVDAEIRWRQLRARSLARMGRHDEALALASEAVRSAADTDYLDLHAKARLALAEVLIQAGRVLEATSALNEALDLQRRKGNVVGAEHTGALLEDLRN
jgi:tetratricopeptide (TPR) repeat protein